MKQVMALESAFSRKLSAFVSLSEAERAVVSDVERRRRRFPARHDLVNQGQNGQSAYILTQGWASSYKILHDGARGVVDIQIPGDFLGLRSILFNAPDQSVESLTPVEVSVVSQALLMETFAKAPRLATALQWAASRDEAIVAEHLVGMGRRKAPERLAHFLLELSARLNLVGLGTKDGYACPLTQYVLADALGLSAVHLNRVLRELREDELLDFHNGRVSFLDFDGLVAMADFDGSYLDQGEPKRRSPLMPLVGVAA
jgi:CRP-like cAMP-binding protein